MATDRRLFLLDGMALVYRAHFAFGPRPIRTSRGFNTSALYGFTNTLLDLLQNWTPTHLAVALDTEAPTARHVEYPEYKAQREAMPEELSAALPHVPRILEAFRVPVLTLDGYEADDLIGTLVKRAEKAGFESFMVTPDKDFGQLVTERTRLWKPGRQGSEVEVSGPAEICARWGIQRVDQVIDLLGLMGDSVDNIPGVPGIGEKTAAKLLGQYGSLEEVLSHADEVKGKLGEALRQHRDAARLSRKLATILLDAPIEVDLEKLALKPRNDEALRALCVEFEFNALGRRLFGDDFKAGRGAPAPQGELFAPSPPSSPTAAATNYPPAESATPSQPPLKTIATVPHDYQVVATGKERKKLAALLGRQPAFCFDTETDSLDSRTARLVGVAFSLAPGRGWFVPVDPATARPAPGTGSVNAVAPELEPFRGVFQNPEILKIGHNLKFDLLVLRWHGVEVRGPYFDTMIAHALVEPELRHGMDYLSEALLGYTPIPITRLIGPEGPEQRTMDKVAVAEVAEYAAEDADVTWQLYEKILPMLRDRGQERVFYEVEMPVLPALVAMEFEGIRVDAATLVDLGVEFGKEMAAAQADVHRLAGREFNVGSNKQLGQVLFDELKLIEKPKKTATGQYATDEQTLTGLAGQHEIVRRLLDYRTVSKLKSTYTDALPATIFPPTGRVHTTFNQAATATGRLNSVDPNLQNIPVRTGRGQEIRRAFIARDGRTLMSADYSQIELRIIAALAHEAAMIEAFRRGEDIHRTTAALVFGVAPEAVTAEMRRRAKMVNFGIAYGISAFGLSQRLGIPRGEASSIIEHYFASYPGVRHYMDATIESARSRGYVETLTGRRRHLRDINSANATVRGAAERNAINAPIQGTAADMIKLAMAHIHDELVARKLKTRMLLQVHDELLFDLHPAEEAEVRTLVEERMRKALPLPGEVPIEVEIGTGANWLEAH